MRVIAQDKLLECWRLKRGAETAGLEARPAEGDGAVDVDEEEEGPELEGFDYAGRVDGGGDVVLEPVGCCEVQEFLSCGEGLGEWSMAGCGGLWNVDFCGGLLDAGGGEVGWSVDD